MDDVGSTEVQQSFQVYNTYKKWTDSVGVMWGCGRLSVSRDKRFNNINDMIKPIENDKTRFVAIIFHDAIDMLRSYHGKT